jgi:A/G-specific adenine glycosylase
MALLRETDGPVPRTRLDLAWPEAAQLERVTRALVADGLADPHDDGLMLARERPRQGD